MNELIVIGMVLTAVAAVVTSYNMATDRYLGGLGSGILGFFVGGVIFVCLWALMLIALGGGVTWFNQETEKHTFNLRALANSSKIEGQFSGGLFVSSGYIDQYPVYQFYGENPDGTHTMGAIEAGDSRVIEEDLAQPYAVCERDVTEAWDWLDLNSSPYDRVSQVDRCVLHVPVGSMGSGVDISDLSR